MKRKSISQQDVNTILMIFEGLLEYCDWDDEKVARIIWAENDRKRMRDVYIKLTDWKEGQA